MPHITYEETEVENFYVRIADMKNKKINYNIFLYFMKQEINSHTTLEEEIKKLQEGETLVAFWSPDKDRKGYYLFIGDDIVNHLWAVTEAEAIQLRDLLNKKFPIS